MSPSELRERALSVLELPKDAGRGEIKRAYRNLARQYHPDLNPGERANQEKFKLIALAYAILTRRRAIGDYEISVLENMTTPQENQKKESYSEWWYRQFSHLF